MNAAADCHTNTTAENMKSLYMLSCCTDTTLLDGKHHATASRGRGGLLHDDYDDGSHEQKNGASSKMPPMKQASSSSSSSRGGDYWTKGGTNNTTPSRSTTPMTTPNQRKIYSANDHHNDHLINNLPHSNRDNNNTKSSSNAKPFASNPLIYRGDDENDSLWEGQSLFSLLASDTDCEENGAGAGATTTTPHTNNGEAYAYYTPHRNNRQQQQQNRSMSYNALSQLNAMPPPSSSSTTAEEDSPMIELSLAKQVANMAQMTNGNLRKTNREMLRNYRTINHGGLSSSSNRTNSMMDSPGSPTKRIREHNNKTIGGHGLRGEGCESGGIGSNSVDVHSHHHHHKKLAAMAMPGSERSSSSAMETDDDNNNTIRPYYMEYINAPPPPVWSKVNATTTTTTTTINTSDIDSELVFTYSFPRLYLQDPTHITEGIVHGKYNCDQMKELWWFHAAQHMETTLRHVQEDHWRALLSTTATTAVAQPSSGKHTTTTTTNSKMESSNSTHSFVTPTDGCASMKELCLGKQQQHPQRSDSETFSPSNTPTNVWSEPCASTMFVRGRTYSKDGVKVESETSIFTMLGVDSFVNGDKSEIIDPSSGTNSYLRRWKRICNDMGLHRPPFLLIINFIVPWGNFQAYLVRPDADEGPFSSCKQNHPSEKAWRKFMEGSTEYRNKRFKLIPRIVAGPWMVKKMVGSTPALIGTKLPMSYRGSISENYLEISLDVTKGPAFGNSVANTVVGKADAVTVDLGFVIEGNEEEGHLPEQVLGLFRLHHLNMKKTPTQSQWNKER